MLRSIETTDISKDISWSGFHIRKFILATVKNGMKQRNIGDNLSLVHILHLHKNLHITYMLFTVISCAVTIQFKFIKGKSKIYTNW